jgi:energy-coupling factor transporter ATP-binding protein EcfA2
MRLKELEIQGFKSFPDKTRITIGEGITGVVGPNGSGKSNISDSIRWVLGETSSKQLRGAGKMEDVIFGGTQTRGAMGYAAVSLTIDNSDHGLEMDADEVTIGRRYYRSGESEYTINGQSVRLKDVYELLLDTGLGRDGYAIVVMAGRGADTMRYGPLRPVGLRDPRTGHRPWANVQLRAENTARTLYNIVGFQTNLKWGEQKRVFSMIPGLEHAEFIRYGVMHRNTFLESPAVLTKGLYLKEHPNVFFAGQITGFEGYMESAASGLLAARNLYARLQGRELPPPPTTTMCGALIDYITTPNKDFQPMGANMGILPRTEEIDTIRDKRERYLALSDAAQAAMRAWAAEAEH